ncbi:MAG: zf-HC2 domain-containing protein [Oscillospiraceae bacterium]|jgi:hypothetical protein|nr:zf-HC2 domain-containing protein [Oscillospiraceae bacterium]
MDPCETYIEAISLDVDGVLDEASRRALEEHLAVCPRCAARRAAFAALRDGLDGWEETPPDTLLPGIRYQIRRERGRSTGRWLRPRRVVPAAAVAVVAALLLITQDRLPWISGAPTSRDLSLTYSQEFDRGEAFLYEGKSESAPGGGENVFDANADSGGVSAASEPGTGISDDVVAPAAPFAAADAPPAANDGSRTAPYRAAISAPDDPELPESDDDEYTAEVTEASYAYVIRWEAAVPEELASLTRAEYNDRTEVIVPRPVAEVWWPAWSEAGAQREPEDVEVPPLAESDNVLVIFEKPSSSS